MPWTQRPADVITRTCCGITVTTVVYNTGSAPLPHTYACRYYPRTVA